MRLTARALCLLVGALIAGSLVAPGLFHSSGSAAQEDGRDAPDVPAAATPQPAAPAGTRTSGSQAAPPFLPLAGPAVQCSDPNDVEAPTTASAGPTAVPLYQPVPWSTGEFVRVTNTGGHGANLRVAPRALARVLRVASEGEVLEIVGADLRVDRVTWAPVRDDANSVGWVVAHMIEGVSGRLGVPPLPPRGPGPEACPDSKRTARTSGGLVLTVLAVEFWALDRAAPRSASGMELLTIEVQIDNVGADVRGLVFLDFAVDMSDNTRRQRTSAGREPSLGFGQIAPRSTVRGWLTFEVAVGTRPTQLIWQYAEDRSAQVPLGAGR